MRAIKLCAQGRGAEAELALKPVKILIGQGAGSGMDKLARMISQKMSAVLGQQLLVENKPGASGAIASEFVAKSTPDGYNLLWGPSATWCSADSEHKKIKLRWL